MQEFTREQQFEVLDIIKGVGSGLNENRKGLVKLFRFTREQHMSYVLIEFRDRLTRFGYRYIIDYLLLNGVEVSVKEEGKNEGLIDGNLNKELIEDLIAIIYSFSGQHYGRSSAKFRKIRNFVKQAVEKEEKSC